MLTQLFRCDVIKSMQSSNASKTTKIADENKTSVPETSTAAEKISKPRTSRSSKQKKQPSETGSAKHRKNGSLETLETTQFDSVESRVIDAVGVMTPAGKSSEIGSKSSEISPSHEEIAKLAHSYWVGRGYQHGSPEEDWQRAEWELKAKR